MCLIDVFKTNINKKQYLLDEFWSSFLQKHSNGEVKNKFLKLKEKIYREKKNTVTSSVLQLLQF